MWGNKRKSNNEPHLKIGINYQQIITYNDILGGIIIKQKLCIVEKLDINTFQNSVHGVVYKANATSGSTCTNNLRETMEGIPITSRFLAGWPFNSVIAWFKVLLSLVR